MKKMFVFSAIVTLSASGALAMMAVKDVHTIDKNDIAIQEFEETDMAPAGLVRTKFVAQKSETNSDDGLGNIISVSVNNFDDLNMEGYLETSQVAVRPEPIVIPFLEDYPIQNIEVKFRLFNRKF